MTIDHLQTVDQLVKKYDKSLFVFFLFFLNYKKTFNSEHSAVFNLLQEQGINENYNIYIENIHKSPTIICLHKSTDKIKIGKKMRQGGYDIV